MNGKLLCVVSLLLGLVIGLTVGRNQPQAIARKPRPKDTALAKAQPVIIAETPDMPPMPHSTESLEKLRDRLTQPQWFHREYRVIETLALVDLKDLPDLARALTSETHAETAVRVAFSRWADHDPPAAFAAAKAVQDVDLRTEALTGVYTGWALVDLEAAKASLKAMKPGKLRDDLGLVLIEEMAVRDPAGALNLITFRTTPHHYGAVESIFTTWMDRDPDQAFAAALEVPNPSARHYALQTAIRVLAQRDHAKAWRTIDQLPIAQRSDARSSVISTVGENDPIRALDYALEISAKDHFFAVNQIFAKWADRDLAGLKSWAATAPNERMKSSAQRAIEENRIRHDPEGMAAHIATLSDPNEIHRLSENLASSWHRTDPDAVVRWVEMLPEGRTRQRVLTVLTYRMSDDDPRRAAELIRTQVVGSQRREMQTYLADRWSSKDPEAALEWFQTLSESGQRATASQILIGLAEEDPKRAAEIMASLPPAIQSRAESAVSLITRYWTGEDPEKTLAWITGLSSDENRQGAYWEFARQLVQVDREKALDMAARMKGNGRASLLHSIARSWAATDRQAALNWIDSLPEEESSKAKNTAIRVIAESNPRLAAETVSAMPAGEVQDRIAHEIVELWGFQDPAGALDWAARFPPGQLRTDAFRNILPRWSTEDVEGAEKFVGALKQRELRREAAESLIEGLAAEVPARAVNWLHEVEDKETRRRLTESIGSTWLQQDEAKAEEWLRKAGFTAERIKTLRGETWTPGQGIPGEPVLDAMGNPIR